jgi:hypothetical protein
MRNIVPTLMDVLQIYPPILLVLTSSSPSLSTRPPWQNVPVCISAPSRSPPPPTASQQPHTTSCPQATSPPLDNTSQRNHTPRPSSSLVVVGNESRHHPGKRPGMHRTLGCRRKGRKAQRKLASVGGGESVLESL